VSFDTEALDPNAQLNIVIEIDGIYFAQYLPDSGLAIDADKLGTIRTAQISGTSVDIRKVKTSLASLTFQLTDIDGELSAFLMSKDDNYLEKEVALHAGFITGSFDFSQYKTFATCRLKSFSKGANVYSFKATEITSLLNQSAYITASTLDSAINESVTTLTLDDATDFPVSGRILIENEYIAYSGKSGNDLTGLTRGDLLSTASAHEEGSISTLTLEIEDNPIDIMLDTMQTELGIATSDIDVTSFTDIRDNFFNATEFRFFVSGIEDVLKFFEDEILQPTNCRITNIDGKIGLTILDQTDFTVQPTDMDETTIIGTPNWSLSSNKVVNEVVIQWGYNEGTRTYSRVSTFDDADSKTKFPNKKTLRYQFKGVKADLDGNLIVANMGARLLARIKNPLADIKVKTFLENSSLKVGDDVSLTHRFLPNQGGGLGTSDQRYEVMAKGFNLLTKEINFTLQVTSFSNLRVGLIAPSPFIVSVIDQKTFTVPIGSQYKAGYFLRLWNTATNDYYSDAAIEIDSVVGNTITMISDFTTTLTTGVKVKFPIYSQSSNIQASKYAYVAPNTHVFSDGTKAYEIIF